MKKVLVSGGAGFIGANLVRRLIASDDFEVFVIEKEGTNMWRLKDIEDKIIFKYVDLRDDKALEQAIQEIKPNIVFHLASYGVYGAVQKDEEQMKLVNVKGTVNLAEALKDNTPELFVFASTSFVYGPKEGAITETDEIGPINEYAVTKYEAEQKLAAISKESNMSVINARLFTPYGTYEDSQRLIPHIILNTLEENTIELGSPNNVRDFIFIEDVMDVFLKMMQTDKKYLGEVFNIGSGKQHSIQQVVETVEKVLDKKLDVSYGGKSSPYQEPKNFIADISKTKKEFDWEPQHDLETGIKKTIEWFEKHKDLYK